MDPSASDTSVDSNTSEEGNVYELLISKYKRALALKNAEIQDLKEQLQDRQNSTGTLEEEIKRLIETLKSTSESLLKYEKDLQDIRTKAGEEVQKLKREKSSLMQEFQEKEQQSRVIIKATKITKLKESVKEIVKKSVEVKEVKEKCDEKISKIKEEKDREMFKKLKETEEKFAEVIKHLKEERELLKKENEKLLRKRSVKGTEKDEIEERKKKRRESQDELKGFGSEEDISVLFEQINRKKKVCVFTHNLR